MGPFCFTLSALYRQAPRSGSDESNTVRLRDWVRVPLRASIVLGLETRRRDRSHVVEAVRRALAAESPRSYRVSDGHEKRADDFLNKRQERKILPRTPRGKNDGLLLTAGGGGASTLVAGQ
jgi:hypothetical protein